MYIEHHLVLRKEYKYVSHNVFEGFNYGRIKKLLKRVQYGMIGPVGWYFFGGLGIGFDGGVDVIKLGIDKVIELYFPERYFRFVIMER